MYHPNYRNIIQHVWLFNEIPNDIIEKLNIPTRDNGIYLIIQYNVNSDQIRIINWPDIATFIGLSFGIT